MRFTEGSNVKTPVGRIRFFCYGELLYIVIKSTTLVQCIEVKKEFVNIAH